MPVKADPVALHAKAARFENPDATETRGHNPLSSVKSQSVTDESEADEAPMKHDRTR